MKTTYYVVIHDAVFDQSEDRNIAERTAALYRKLGFEDVVVTTEEPF